MDNNTTSHPLATESFSFSWLETESQHKNIPNNNNHLLLLDETTHNFYFDTSNSASLVHADKLFSNGLILPRFLDDPSKNNAAATSSIILPSSTPPLVVNYSSKINHQSTSFRRIVLAKCSKLCSWETLSKYATCLIPMKDSIGRGATRVDDVNRLTWEVNKNWSANSNNNNNNNNNNAFDEVASYSPRKEFGPYSSAWSDVDEGSIRDAIIYCKRSNGLY